MEDKRYLISLIKEGEHQQQDFKYRVSDACKLAKSVSAFANTDGGRLLIGVRDDGHLSGVRSEEEIYMMHQAAYKYCRPEASIKFDTYHIEGRTIVIATVPPSDKRPVFAIDEDGKTRAYIRIADENIAHMILFKERTCILRIFVHPAYIRLALRIVDAVIVEERAGSRSSDYLA